MAEESFKYDVAFSFLSQDESIARALNDKLKDSLRTFIYSDPERQTMLAGRDGEVEFNRVFGVEARTVAILYRQGWGDRGFTAVESTAIRDRAHEFGYDFTTLIPLDDPPQVPKWFPRARLWVNWKTRGVDGAAAVIESRANEVGAESVVLTAADLAVRARAEMSEAAERRAFWTSPEGVLAAQQEFDALFAEAMRVSQASVGLIGPPDRRNPQMIVLPAALGAGTTTFVQELKYTNQLTDSVLYAVEYDGTSNDREDYHFDLGPNRERGWRKGTEHAVGQFFTTQGLVDHFAQRLIERIRRPRRRHEPRVIRRSPWS